MSTAKNAASVVPDLYARQTRTDIFEELHLTQRVDRTRVTSSVIRSVGYDAESRELEVELVSDHIYRYRDVPPFLYEGFLAAKSKGAFFNQKIARRFEYEQLQ